MVMTTVTEQNGFKNVSTLHMENNYGLTEILANLLTELNRTGFHIPDILPVYMVEHISNLWMGQFYRCYHSLNIGE